MGTGSSRIRRRRSYRRRNVPHGLLLVCLTVAVVGGLLGVSISMGWIMPAGRAIGRFLDFFGGVFTLVSLSLAVMVGLLATDRAILAPRHRIHAQSIHRAFAFIAVAMLLVHLVSQLARHRIGAVAAFVPFAGSVAYGLGTLAFYLMVVAIGSGIARGRFAATGRPWVWRLLHLTVYLAWPMGIWHGLNAGRDPAPWVTAGYGLCVVAVVAALIARPFLRGRRKP